MKPLVYEAIQHLVGARAAMKRFAEETIRAKPGDRLIDIGCGNGTLLRYLPDGVWYFGIDQDPDRITRAIMSHGGRATFKTGSVTDIARHHLADIDIAVAYGILHHIDDGAAARVLDAIASALKPDGRLFTVDPCFHDDESPLQRFAVSLDLGCHVRHFDRYAKLVRGSFQHLTTSLNSGHFPFPHSVCIIEAREH